MARVTSADATEIAYERAGDGPTVILVGGGLDDGAENAPLMTELATRFTVVNYARRGRAGSGNTLPYALEREVEDIAALIAEAGGPAHVFGASSGGALALEAAAGGLAIDRVAIYEVPYPVGMVDVWRQYVEQLAVALAEGRRGDALALFMRVAGATEESIAAARGAPLWARLERLAPTLAYDAACLGDGRPPARLAAVACPVLVLTGEDAAGFYGPAADAVVASVPTARRELLAGQGHVADPAVLAEALSDFFAG
jgi:pimeloyl-ACP methyl ester carboxylesterase